MHILTQLIIINHFAIETETAKSAVWKFCWSGTGRKDVKTLRNMTFGVSPQNISCKDYFQENGLEPPDHPTSCWFNVRSKFKQNFFQCSDLEFCILVVLEKRITKVVCVSIFRIVILHSFYYKLYLCTCKFSEKRRFSVQVF